MPGVIVPHLGFATDEVTIVHWHKTVGDSVTAGEPLVDIAAEKAVSMVEAEASGTLLAAYAPVGAVVAEGSTIGWVGAVGEQPPEGSLEVVGWEEELAPPPPEFRHFIQSRPHGGAPPAPAAGRPSRKRLKSFLSRARRKITAQRMARSWVAAPKVDLLAEIDFSRVVAHRERLKAGGVDAPSFNVYIAHAVVRAFEEMPELNVNWIDDRAVPLDGIHVGVAVSMDDTLMTISMKDIGGQPLEEIQRRFRGLIKKAVGMTLKREEMYGNSLTVTNLGEFEITAFTPILNPPEIFILGIGKLADRVVPKNGEIAIVPMSQFFLSFDHRGVDGAPASRLLRQIKYHLEHYGEEGAAADA